MQETVGRNVFVLADILVRLSQKLCILIVKIISFVGSKYPKNVQFINA